MTVRPHRRLKLTAHTGTSVSAILILSVAALHAQSDAVLRVRVADILAQAGDRPLPQGDTLVEFAKQGPILYFTVANTADTVASSMVRNDGLVGWANSSWSHGRPTRFTARWARPESVEVDISGQVVGMEMRLRGAQLDHLTLPTLPWGVADYGMEDQLVPLFQTLPRDTAQNIAVWRPYGQKWDTVTVRTHLVEGVLLVSEGAVTWGISSAGRLLLHQDRAQGALRRPLEGTASFAEYRRILHLAERPH